MAVLAFSRKRKMTPHLCLSAEKSPPIDVSRRQTQDAVSVAVEHVNHLRRMGVGINQAMAAINRLTDADAVWDDVVCAYAQAFERVRQA